MFEARLDGAILYEELGELGRISQQADGLSAEMLSEAHVYKATQLPPEISNLPAIRMRIVKCEAERATVEQGLAGE
ncbi:hypothetical protein ACFWAT_09120 [Streptomyces syringium]|uniref:hypothetical protein n=1 Tax=Streptomyces syringium TaxID=76729 RepID=UPI00366273D0